MRDAAQLSQLIVRPLNLLLEDELGEAVIDRGLTEGVEFRENGDEPDDA